MHERVLSGGVSIRAISEEECKPSIEADREAPPNFATTTHRARTRGRILSLSPSPVSNTQQLNASTSSMPITLGSVGDIISISLIVKDLVKALDDCRGSASEYQALIRELWVLDRVLLEIELLTKMYEQTAELNALCVTAKNVADSCRRCIEIFQENIKKYDDSLGSAGTGKKIQDISMKIRWRIAHSDDLERFRAEVNAHSSSLNMLLVTASVNITRRNDEQLREQRIAKDEKDQKTLETHEGLLADIRDRLDENTSLIKTAADGMSSILKSELGPEFRSIMGKIFAMNVVTFRIVAEIRASLPNHSERSLIQEPFILEDAIGRITPVHLQFIASWDAFDSVLEKRFQNVQGHEKVLSKDFVLQEHKSRRDIVRSRPWEGAFLPGQRVDMSIVFNETEDVLQACCPGCREICADWSERGSRCMNCGVWFDRVIELLDGDQHKDSLTSVEKDPVLKSPRANSSSPTRKGTGNSPDSSEKGNRNELADQPRSSRKRRWGDYGSLGNAICDFKRVRIVSRRKRFKKTIFERGPRNETETSLTSEDDRAACKDPDILPCDAEGLVSLNYEVPARSVLARRLDPLSSSTEIPGGSTDKELPLDWFPSLIEHDDIWEACDAFLEQVESSSRSDDILTKASRGQLDYILGKNDKLILEGTTSTSEGQDTPKAAESPKNSLVHPNTTVVESESAWRRENDSPSPSVEELVSDLGASVLGSSNQSLTSSIINYVYENGRRYHAYQNGKYWLPNDEKEQDRMDMQHHVIFKLVLNDKLFLAPVREPKNILDHGTGTGIWSIEVGDTYPKAHVMGTDLSPIQPTFVPPNTKYVVDDFSLEWLGYSTKFDLIHCSLGNAFSARDWKSFLVESYSHLTPGGWVELKDINIAAMSHDYSLPQMSAIRIWHGQLLEGAATSKISLQISPGDLEVLFQEAGFVNVTIKEWPLPIGLWPKDPGLKKIGAFQSQVIHDGLEAFSLAIFTRALGWDLIKIEKLLEEVREELNNRSYHWYWPFFVVYGQKPEGR